MIRNRTGEISTSLLAAIAIVFGHLLGFEWWFPLFAIVGMIAYDVAHHGGAA